MIRITAGPAMPPIGFAAPPAAASHAVPIFFGLVILAAGPTVVLTAEIGRALARMAPVQIAAVHLNAKDQSRCCDGNGNRLVLQ
jgi:hypothetical protein